MKPVTVGNGKPNEDGGGAGHLDIVAARVAGYIECSRAPNTVKAYESDWCHFKEWCVKNGRTVLPASVETVKLYLADLAEDHKPSTLARHLASISEVHQVAGHETPTRASGVRLVMAGIRRTKGTAQLGKMPILVEDLKGMMARLPEGLIGVRDRALLLIGFSGGFRRSEIVGLDRPDIEIVRDGMVLTMRRSKADQEKRGRKVGIPLGKNPESCPVRAVQAWLQVSAITSGPVFRPITRHGKIIAQRLSANAVAMIVKRYAKAIGLNASQFSGHSLRAGLVTSATLAGKTEGEIMRQTRHKSAAMVRRYIRDANLFRNNVAGALGL
jgi:site-specific recombinase XerD